MALEKSITIHSLTQLDFEQNGRTTGMDDTVLYYYLKFKINDISCLRKNYFDHYLMIILWFMTKDKELWNKMHWNNFWIVHKNQ